MGGLLSWLLSSWNIELLSWLESLVSSWISSCLFIIIYYILTLWTFLLLIWLLALLRHTKKVLGPQTIGNQQRFHWGGKKKKRVVTSIRCFYMSGWKWIIIFFIIFIIIIMITVSYYQQYYHHCHCVITIVTTIPITGFTSLPYHEVVPPCYKLDYYPSTLWLFNIAMENHHF